MAYETGTATDQADLYAKMIAFLTTDAGLVLAGQEWVEAWSAPSGAPNSTDVVLQGPGLSAADEIYVGFRLLENSGSDKYDIQLCGMSGVNAAATQFTEHVNVSPVAHSFADNQAMTYWFVASGRRFVAVWKVGTIYETLYAGLALPYALPDTYPYPLFIGGTAGTGGTGVGVIDDWRSLSDGHSAFPYSYYATGAGFIHESSAHLMDPAGQWLRCNSGSAAPAGSFAMLGPKEFGEDLNNLRLASSLNSGVFGYETLRLSMREAFGGAYALTPISLNQRVTSIQAFGVLDGVYHVPGFGNSAENTVTVDGVVHLVIPNVFRSGAGDFWALALA